MEAGQRRRYQYSLRTLLIIATVVAIACSWYAYEMQKTAKIRAAVTKINSHGGEADYWDSGAGTIFLRYLKISDAGLVRVKDLTNVTFLSLVGTEITDAGLVNLKGLTSLEVLRLDGTQVTDAGLVHLKNLTKLQQLCLARTQVTDAGLVHLSGLTRLSQLDLGHAQVTDEDVRKLQEALPNCEIIHYRSSARPKRAKPN